MRFPPAGNPPLNVASLAVSLYYDASVAYGTADASISDYLRIHNATSMPDIATDATTLSPPVFPSLPSTNNRVAHAKGLLQAMREETEAMKKDPARAKPSEVRVRENLQNTLTRKFVDLAKDYQNRQVCMYECMYL